MRKAVVFSVLVLAGPLSAQEYRLGDLTIDRPVAFATARTARSGGGFMRIANAGGTGDRLMEVRADFPQVMIHETTVDDQGVARMGHVPAIDIPAGATVNLGPGGYHVMFMGLNGDPLEAGETIPATLVFEKAGELEVVFKVEKPRHTGHGHSGH
ncbi:MAG: copper chaperone PCu(A)C [Rhodobacteraceae bacterium]|nr:copper chaperone PCu(A)C [Paracoccaceae bacterium]